MLKWFREFLELFRWPDYPDPVKDCPVYLDKEYGSCCHVDGPICPFPKCSMIDEYHVKKQEVAQSLRRSHTPPQ